MDKARALLKSLLYPPRWVVIAVPPLSFAALVFIFAAKYNRSIPAYLIYGMSAYSLTIWLAAIPGLTSRIKSAIMKNRFVRKIAAKVLSAMMPILGLQTAMIAQFSGDAEHFRRMMNTITGSAVYAKELCEAAGVNRSTFYLHYETMGDLLAECTQYLNDQFLSYMQHDSVSFVAKLRDRPLDELYLVTPEYLIPYLSYIKEN